MHPHPSLACAERIKLPIQFRVKKCVRLHEVHEEMLSIYKQNLVVVLYDGQAYIIRFKYGVSGPARSPSMYATDKIVVELFGTELRSTPNCLAF